MSGYLDDIIAMHNIYPCLGGLLLVLSLLFPLGVEHTPHVVSGQLGAFGLLGLALLPLVLIILPDGMIYNQCRQENTQPQKITRRNQYKVSFCMVQIKAFCVISLQKWIEGMKITFLYEHTFFATLMDQNKKNRRKSGLRLRKNICIKIFIL